MRYLISRVFWNVIIAIKRAFIHCRIIQQKKTLIGLNFFQYIVLLNQMPKLSFVLNMLMLLRRQFHFSMNKKKKPPTITFTAVKVDTKEQLPLLNGQIKVTLNKLC